MEDEKKKSRVSRRHFLWSSATAGAAVLTHACARSTAIVPREAVAKSGGVPPSEKINIACIGVGGKGKSDVSGMLETGKVNIVAACDIDGRIKGSDATLNQCPDLKWYQDYRIMLDEVGDKIDAVTVSTPDHVHAAASMAAMKRGKHVFCQKPLTHNLHEARVVTEAARQYKVASLMGIQGHSGEGIRLIREWIEQGAIGKVKEVHIWTNRPIWPQGIERPTREDPIPAGLAWDEWIGPAPMRPFALGVYHRFNWRGWYDFGCGAIGDIACHSMDAPVWTLQLGHPTSVQAETAPLNAETFPTWSTIEFQFPARGDMPPVRLMWYDGKKIVDGAEKQNMPPRPEALEAERNLQDNGQLYFGEDGVIMCGMYGDSPRIIPEARMKDFMASDPKKTLERSIGHYQEFVEACKGGKPAGANFDFAGPLTEIAHLGNLAVRSGSKIEFDPVAMRVTNCEQANPFVQRTYREGWTL